MGIAKVSMGSWACLNAAGRQEEEVLLLGDSAFSEICTLMVDIAADTHNS